MAKIDELLALADSVTASSDALLLSMSELCAVVSLLVEIHHSLVSADAEIDKYSQLMARNNRYLNEMHNLHEKLYLLEANMQTNDLYTNETSFSNLRKEYSYLWRSFGFDNMEFAGKETVAREPLRLRLNHMLSILNLNLKPLRCSSVKKARKRSRYRVSGTFNLNPLAPDVLQFSRMAAMHTASEDDSRNVLNASSSDISSIMDPSPRRNSAMSTESLDQSDVLREGSTMLRSPVLPLPAGSLRDDCIAKLSLGDARQLDFDYDSSSPGRAYFDDFSEFSRKSRVDLHGAFPPLNKSLSHESVFSGPQMPQWGVAKKFHNPVDFVYTARRGTSTQSTVEATYSLPFGAPLNFKDHSRKLLAEETQPIAVKTDTCSLSLTPTRKRAVRLFLLMNSPLGSPRGLRDSPPALRPTGRKELQGSIDLIPKSLYTSFMNLVGTSSGVAQTSVKESKSPPEKIKKMRKDLKGPISAQSELMLKRRPPAAQRRDSRLSVQTAHTTLRKKDSIPPVLSLCSASRAWAKRSKNPCSC